MSAAHSDAHTGPMAWADVLRAECRALNPSFGGDTGDTGDASTSAGPDGRLQMLNRAALAERHSALCLSGGGIRSASFAVGVMQGLARHGLLERFDYLSTVSGGGFAGA